MKSWIPGLKPPTIRPAPFLQQLNKLSLVRAAPTEAITTSSEQPVQDAQEQWGKSALVSIV